MLQKWGGLGVLYRAYQLTLRHPSEMAKAKLPELQIPVGHILTHR